MLDWIENYISSQKKALDSIAPGTAPGPSGWRAEHLKPVMADSAAAAGVCALVRDIINGEFASSAQAEALLTMSRGFGGCFVSMYVSM